MNVKYLTYGAATVLAILLIAVIAMAHNARKERFMQACLAENTPFECEYRWDTLMARERAANTTD